MKLKGAWLERKATQAVMTMLSNAGYQAYLVGGCVRNALLDAPVDDIDITTDALPDVVTKLAKKAGFKPVPTGIDHGTITVVADGTGYEITTYRADVTTDGRRATVRFSKDIHEDARRRDFTMNALYADNTGEIVDPLNGLPDLQARKVRFIEDPTQRIQEDYLRILRYFRFCAWYGDPNAGFDPDALNAIARNLDGLDTLSRERVGQELKKLMSAPDPAPATAAMQHTGALNKVLPGSDGKALAILVMLEQQANTKPDALRRLAGLGVSDGTDLRFSKAQQRRLALLHAEIGSMSSPGEMGFRHGFETARDILMLRSALIESPFDAEKLRSAQRGADAKFPVTAADLMPAFQGPELGKELRRLEQIWIESNFMLSRNDLLK